MTSLSVTYWPSGGLRIEVSNRTGRDIAVPATCSLLRVHLPPLPQEKPLCGVEATTSAFSVVGGTEIKVNKHLQLNWKKSDSEG